MLEGIVMTMLDWITKLIAFNTTSHLSNLPLIEYLANTLSDYQLNPILIHALNEPKANLLATIPGRNGCIAGGIVLSGHTDVVPVDGQSWASDPFHATLKNNKIYGRGACDMKGFIAVVMSLIPTLKAMNLAFPIHFSFSYDEEIGCLGAGSLIEKMKTLHYQPKACIVGEPTSMQPVIAHKGIQSYHCQIHGVAAHSSLTPQGCNAIEHAAALIGYIRSLANYYKSHGTQDNVFDVPYTTFSTNLINGGNATNIIPSSCGFSFEFRHLATDNAEALHQKIEAFIDEQLLPSMKKEHRDSRVTLERKSHVPGLNTAPSEAIVQAALALCQSNQGSKVAYATEAGLFQQAHIPTIVCGPGSIDSDPQFLTLKDQRIMYQAAF